MYHAFEVYVDEFLRRIEPYHDMVYIVVFTEGIEPEGLNPYRDAKKHAKLLRGTLGSLPTRIDPSLRGGSGLGTMTTRSSTSTGPVEFLLSPSPIPSTS